MKKIWFIQIKVVLLYRTIKHKNTEAMTKSEIFTSAHKLAKTMKLQAGYSMKISIALRVVYRLSKVRYNKATTVTLWSNAEFSLASGICSIENNKMREKGLQHIETVDVVDFISFPETASQKFTRLAVQNAA